MQNLDKEVSSHSGQTVNFGTGQMPSRSGQSGAVGTGQVSSRSGQAGVGTGQMPSRSGQSGAVGAGQMPSRSGQSGAVGAGQMQSRSGQSGAVGAGQMPSRSGQSGAVGAGQMSSRSGQAPLGGLAGTIAVPRRSYDFEETVRLALEDHPYLMDHAIVRQPEFWEHQEDLNPVVPFTMTIELLAEIAMKHAPGRKLVKIGKLAAYRWIGVDTPFKATVKGKWRNPDVLELALGDYAKAEFVFNIEPPVPSEAYTGDIDIGEDILEILTAEEYYGRYSFHGPQYRSSTEMTKVCSRGLQNYAVKQAGKGSLLDIMGQQLGLFLHLTQTENTISFPVRLKELVFYSDIFDQQGVFEHTMIVTRLTDSLIVADMVLKRGGKIWSVAKDFVCQRFVNIPVVWDVILNPEYSRLADEIAPGVFHYSSTTGFNLQGLLDKRYLNHDDRAGIADSSSNIARRKFLLGRIVLKDAVRSMAAVLEKSGGDGTGKELSEEGVGGSSKADMLYPIEIFCAQNDMGQPYVYSEGRSKEILKNFFVSVSQAGNDAVAIVSTEPVGIGLEKIERKTEEFLRGCFTDKERELLKDMDELEGPIRFLAAMEACAKKFGDVDAEALNAIEICSVEDDVLTIGSVRVRTMKLGEYISGWTVQ